MATMLNLTRLSKYYKYAVALMCNHATVTDTYTNLKVSDYKILVGIYPMMLQLCAAGLPPKPSSRDGFRWADSCTASCKKNLRHHMICYPMVGVPEFDRSHAACLVGEIENESKHACNDDPLRHLL